MTTNIRLILDKIMRHPLLQDVSLETVVDYTIDFIRIVGVPTIFENKVEKLTLSNYRCKLPCDFHRMIQVRLLKGSNPCFRYSGDSFHLTSGDKNNRTDLTYKIQGCILYASNEDSEIEISYEAIGVDQEGYPLIPDNSSFTRALENYIKLQKFTILFDLGKLTQQVYENTKQQYSWSVGDCQSEFNRLTLDQAESFFNSWKTLLIRDNEHSKGFINNGSKEHIKLQ